jgi:hypothetical protein
MEQQDNNCDVEKEDSRKCHRNGTHARMDTTYIYFIYLIFGSLTMYKLQGHWNG